MRVRDLLLPVALSLGALGLVLWLTWEPGAFDAVRGTFRPALFGLAVTALCGYLWMGALRFRHISRGALTATDGLRGQLTWEFMSAVTPSAMGGAPLAAYFIARENGLAVGRVSAIMLFTMLMDQIWFAVAIVALYLGAVWLPVFPTGLGAAGVGTVAAYLGGMLVYIAFFAYATLVRPEIIGRVAGWIVRIPGLRRFRTTVERETTKLGEQAVVLRGQPAGFYLTGALLTAAYWLLRYGTLLLVALSFTRDLRPVLMVFRTAGLWLAGLIMPTPGGSGGIEGLFVLFVAPLLPEGYGGPVLLAWRGLAYYAVLIVGLFVAGRAVRALLSGDAPSAPASPTSLAHPTPSEPSP